LFAYAWYARRPSWVRLLGVIFAFVCALMSKPMAVTLPFTLLLLDIWPLRRITFTRETRARWLYSLWKLCIEKWPLFIIAAISSVITCIAQQNGGAVRNLQNWPLWMRLCNVAISYCRYVRIMVWPDPLIAYYFHERYNISVSAAVLSAIALLLVTIVCWYMRKERPYCLFGWLWFLGTLIPVIGIVQAGDQALAERYTYIPYIGLFIAIVWLAGDAVARSPKIRAAALLLAAAVIAACAVKTDAQVKVWKNTVTLFSHVLAVDTRGGIPNSSLGVVYAKQGKFAEAIECFKRVLLYTPDSYEAYNNLGTALNSQGSLQEALKVFRISLAIKPDQVKPHSTIGRILAETHHLPESVEEYTQALRLDPADAYAHNDLGVVLFQLGEYEKAAAQFSEAARLDPTYAEAKKNLQLAQAQFKNKMVHRTGK